MLGFGEGGGGGVANFMLTVNDVRTLIHYGKKGSRYVRSVMYTHMREHGGRIRTYAAFSVK